MQRSMVFFGDLTCSDLCGVFCELTCFLEGYSAQNFSSHDQAWVGGACLSAGVCVESELRYVQRCQELFPL